MYRTTRWAALITLLLLFSAPLRAQESRSSLSNEAPDVVKVDSVVLRLLDEADAPARDAGVVAKIVAREGQSVRKGDLLALLDDAAAQLAVQAAELELTIAEERATNDVSVRYAEKARDTAAAELRRSQESIEKFPKSVSQSQIDVEQLTLDKARLEHEQALQDQKLAGFERRLAQAKLDAERLRLEQRRIVAPIDGVVVEVETRLGEWLESGQKALRLVSTNRLKAEGFVAAGDATPKIAGSDVWLTLDSQAQAKRFRGRLVFASPEVDPINNQVRVWAEIENSEGLLRPGQRASMSIAPADQTQ